jgi:RHS repeat-associated protein
VPSSALGGGHPSDGEVGLASYLTWPRCYGVAWRATTRHSPDILIEGRPIHRCNSSKGSRDTLTQSYDSFGNLTASTGSIVNRFRYTAREFDSETNLYFYRARYFDSSPGRFINEDPVRFEGGINFYAYTKNSPITWFDPNGELTQVAIGGRVADNVFGHLSIIINGEVFSYGTNYTNGPPGTRDWGRSGQDFLTAQSSARETALLDLRISQAQEDGLLTLLRQNNPYSSPYTLLRHSCVTVVENALVKAGILRDAIVVSPNAGEFTTAGALTPVA